MLTEISLNILDVAENSASAGASLIEIYLEADTKKDTLTLLIRDDGCGMTPEQLSGVEDPFFTTRSTRKVGLGVPFLKQAAESTGGSFVIESEPGRGTSDKAVFGLSHIDRMPLGDISATIKDLIICHPDIDFLYSYKYDGNGFVLDTREFKKVLAGVPINSPEVLCYIQEYLEENKQETDKGMLI